MTYRTNDSEFVTFLYNYFYDTYLKNSPTRQKKFVIAWKKWEDEQQGKRCNKWIIFKMLIGSKNVWCTESEFRTAQAIRKKYFFWRND